VFYLQRRPPEDRGGERRMVDDIERWEDIADSEGVAIDISVSE
jgi:hypothetical protein